MNVSQPTRATLRHGRCPQAARRQRGMTLVEVLVTLVIISVGLLGVAALQLATVRNNYDAFVRSQAAMLAADVLDRIRVNRERVGDYEVDFSSGGGGGEDESDEDATEDEGAVGQAQRDVQQWKQTLASQLPQGDGAISYDPATRVVTITIAWGEREAAADGLLRFVTSSRI